MRSAFITFDKSAAGAEFQGEVRNAFDASGIELTAEFSLSSSDETAFKKCFQFVKDNFDSVIMCGGSNNTYNVKEIVASLYCLTLTENANAKAILKTRLRDPYYSEDLYLLPEEASLIPNELGVFQGYMCDSDGTLIVISDEPCEAEKMLKDYALPYLQNKYKVKPISQIFKIFNAPPELLNGTLAEFSRRTDGLRLNAVTDCYDTQMELLYDGNAVSASVAAETVRGISDMFDKYVYATEDIGLAETLVGLLKIKGRHISIAESFTGGGIASAMVKVSGASAVLTEGIVAYTEQAKENRLGVPPEVLRKYGAVSEDTAYEMAAGLISGGADYALATTGLAGPTSDGSGKPVGLCYIACGTKDGVYVYGFNFKGTREKVIRQGINTALYKAILAVKGIKR